MMQVDRYVFKSAIFSFLIVFGVFFLFLNIGDFIEIQRRGFMASLGHLWFLSLLKTPHQISKLYPLIAMISSGVVLLKFLLKNELLILMTTGRSPLRLMRSFIIMGVLFGGAFLVFWHPVSVFCMRLYQVEEAHFTREKIEDKLCLLKSGTWVRFHEKEGYYILHARAVNRESQDMEDLSLYLFDKENAFQKSWHAKKCFFLKEGIILDQARVIKKDGRIVQKEKYFLPIKLDFDLLCVQTLKPELLYIWSLPFVLSWLKTSALSTPYKMLWHRTFSFFFQCIAGVFLVFVCCLSLKGSSVVFFCLMGFLLCLLFHFLSSLFYAMGDSGAIRAWMAAWSPCVILGVLGFMLMDVFQKRKKGFF